MAAPLAVMAVQLDRERLIHKLQNDLFPEFGGVFALIKTDGVLLSSDSGSAVFEELSFPSIFTFLTAETMVRFMIPQRLLLENLI